jgi:hypothetical protein
MKKHDGRTIRAALAAFGESEYLSKIYITNIFLLNNYCTYGKPCSKIEHLREYEAEFNLGLARDLGAQVVLRVENLKTRPL